ncbi:MAG TPA: adenylate/guanylate cyclase domain-containing protein [Candidatus Limnocylindrales bacterium]|nr:adenylate/guanylate cyclase domain-containing protein [Candidatus Limnocylindrales bacterium]
MDTRAGRSPDAAAKRLTPDELAASGRVDPDRVRVLVDARALEPGDDGLFDAGDVHWLRLLVGFEDAGVPIAALGAARDAGLVSFKYYHRLHVPPAALSGRTLRELTEELGDAGAYVERLFAALGVAQPEPDAPLGVDDEAVLRGLAPAVANAPQPDLALRAVRLLGEAARRSANGALSAYEESVRRLGPAAEVLTGDAYEAVFWPWFQLARSAPGVAEWLTARFFSRAIDEFSISVTEQILARGGYIASRPDLPPAVAFVDLSGFTRLTEEIGDQEAAGIALRLGDLAADVLASHQGRTVKLLGDGVLARFPDAVAATNGSLDLLAALPAAGLPSGHAGVAAGPLIDRDGDVFGRTVNTAARISDVTPDGALRTTLETAALLSPDRFELQPVGEVDLDGIGRTDLVEVSTRV